MYIFGKKNLKPMLISEMVDPFDSPDYIFYLKLDWLRCLFTLIKVVFVTTYIQRPQR